MKTQFKNLLLLMLLLPVMALAQTVTGVVTEASSSLPLPGVNVIIKNTTTGTATDFDGNFTINATPGDVLVFSYVGYQTQEINYTGQPTISVALEDDAAALDEVVVIGYGTTTKKDATGSVDLVTTDDFNKGAIVSTDQLLNGKAAGVRITNAGGSPDSSPNIRIRGGSSLTATNNPLIVIDGVPLSNVNPAGVSNPLSLVNPNDVESFSILKDASATAIYGARASNGVIIITTKKGTSGEVKFNFTTDVSMSKAGEGLDTMTSSEYVRFIQEYLPTYTSNLGVPVGSVTTNESITQIIDTPDGPRAIYDTDWRDTVLRTAISTNANFSARANLFNRIPFRGSVGYTNSEGVVLNDDYERVTTSFRLSPKFFNDALSVDANAKLTYADKNAADTGGALGGALVFDPTKPVFDNSGVFGGYYQNVTSSGIIDGQANPLQKLFESTNPQRAYRFLGNIKLDYKLPFLNGLKAVVNLGLDASRSKTEQIFFNNAPSTYRLNNDGEFIFNPGLNYRENQHQTNTTVDAYLEYNKDLEDSFINNFDMQLGYAYQSFKNDGNKLEFRYNQDTGIREINPNDSNPNNRYFNPLTIVSFWGRSNINLADKYLITLSLRADASSLFVNEDVWSKNAWGYFPSAAFAWKVKNEKFLENVNFINDFKVRLSWGKTGQNDISSVSYFPTTPLFTPGSNNSQYLPGAGLYSADPNNPNLTWEKTSTYNLGVDFDFFKNGFISGSFDIYSRRTKDLLLLAPVPPGQAFGSSFIGNTGRTKSEGFELILNLNPIQTETFNFNIGTNLSYNKTEITELGGLSAIPGGSTLRGTGAFLQRNALGYQAYSAYVFKQLYDASGNPIPGAFADRNGDGEITDSDRYYKQIAPNWTYGFSLNFNYKNWDLSSSFRGQIGGNIYDFNKLNLGFIESAQPANNSSISNVLNFYDGAADPAFQNVNGNIQFSDYYLSDASFLRCDNIALGHRFDNLIKNGSVRIYGAVTNPFIITDYDGQDPENFGGVDGNFYPRPRVYTLGLNLDF